jgi:hypothetical protein
MISVHPATRSWCGKPMEYNECITLVAHIVEQARKDLGSKYPLDSCPCDHIHRPRKCAREFLLALDFRLRDMPKPSASELALTVMEIIE